MKRLIQAKKKAESTCGGKVPLLLDLRDSEKITNESGTEIKAQNPEKVSLFNREKSSSKQKSNRNLNPKAALAHRNQRHQEPESDLIIDPKQLCWIK